MTFGPEPGNRDYLRRFVSAAVTRRPAPAGKGPCGTIRFQVPRRRQQPSQTMNAPLPMMQMAAAASAAPAGAPPAPVPRLREIPYNYTSFSDREIVIRLLG